MPQFMTIYQFINPFLDKKNMEPLNTQISKTQPNLTHLQLEIDLSKELR